MLSSIAQDHVARPRNTGRLESANAKGQYGTPGDGPYITLYLEIETFQQTADRQSARIACASYECNGCPSTIACASMVAQIVIGRTIDQARKLTADDLVLLLNGLPEGKGHCAEMAVHALKIALGENQS